MSEPDLNAWRTFVAVAEEGTMTRAAERLGNSVPTVSKGLAALEQQLGVALFHRTSRRVSLSPTGEALLPEARTHVAALSALAERLRDRDGPPRGRIRMSAPLSFSVRHLGAPLTAFLSAHDGVGLDLQLSDETVDLVDGGFDLALRIGSLADSSLRARKLCDIRVPLVAAPAYLDAHGEPSTPANLATHATIAFSQTASPTSWTFRHDLDGERTVEVTPRLLLDNGDLGLEALRPGIGIAPLPDFFVGEDIAAGRLREIMLPWYRPAIGLHIVTPPTRLQPRRVRLLIEALAAAFRKQSWSY
jgi:DNA-binding transcriptional LysR family regulator